LRKIWQTIFVQVCDCCDGRRLHTDIAMKNSRWSLLPFFVLLVLVGPGCATKTGTSAVSAEHTAAAPGWVRTELYFSIGDWMETAFSTEGESRWEEFLEREVTPRFPDGLTVLEAYGQWRSPKPGSPVLRERSRVLVILHPSTQEASDKIEMIRAAWKKGANEQSVLRVSQPVDVRS
jgi:hypothetical protein